MIKLESIKKELKAIKSQKQYRDYLKIIDTRYRLPREFQGRRSIRVGFNFGIGL
jgi:hypothetical protein